MVESGTFNVLEPAEFESVYRAVLGELDERPTDVGEVDAIDELSEGQRQVFAAALATMFYAGLRMGEIRDLEWRCIDFARSLMRVESGFVEGERSTPKSKRPRSTPLVPLLAQRLAALSTTTRFAAPDDYVFSTEIGRRITDKRLRAVFYAALARTDLGDRRDKTDRHGNPRDPMTPARSSSFVLHLGGQCVARHEGPGVRRPRGYQDDDGLRPPPDQGRRRSPRWGLPRPGARCRPSGGRLRLNRASNSFFPTRSPDGLRDEMAVETRALDEPLLTASQLSVLLGGIPPKTVLQYARDGRLPCLRIGRHVRFVKSDVDGVLDSQRGRSALTRSRTPR